MWLLTTASTNTHFGSADRLARSILAGLAEASPRPLATHLLLGQPEVSEPVLLAVPVSEIMGWSIFLLTNKAKFSAKLSVARICD